MSLGIPETAEFETYVRENLMDVEGIHHEFSQDEGLHGRKIDFDLLPDQGKPFDLWVDVNVMALGTLFPNGLDAVLSVDSGTNRLVGPVAERLGANPMALYTRKISKNQVALDEQARRWLRNRHGASVAILEDTATEGTASASAVQACRAVDANASVVNTVQRSLRLPRLDEINAEYHSIILIELPNYTPAQCRKIGYCALGWELVPHSSTKS